jgi:mTERF
MIPEQQSRRTIRKLWMLLFMLLPFLDKEQLQLNVPSSFYSHGCHSVAVTAHAFGVVVPLPNLRPTSRQIQQGQPFHNLPYVLKAMPYSVYTDFDNLYDNNSGDYDEGDHQESDEEFVNGDDDVFFQQVASTVANISSSSFIAAPLTLDQLSEAFAANVSYFYLKNELGLSDTAMWRITYEASSALGMTTTVIRQKVRVLQDTMNLTEHDIRTIIERQPTVLHLSADKNIAPTLLFLLRALMLGRNELRTLIVTCPAILCYSITNLKAKIQFFTNVMKYSIDECRELLLKKPDLFRSSVQTGLVPHFQFLSSDMEFSLDQLQCLVLHHPSILLYSLEQNLIPKLVYFMIMRLQMSTKHVHKLLLSFPYVLNCNLDRTILPMTVYFVNELDFSPVEFRNMLLKFPRLVTHSLRKIKRTIGYFRFELNMLPIQVKKVIYRAPAVLGLNLDNNIQGKVEYLQSSLDLSDEQLHIVLAAMPSLLLLNSDGNVRPKLEFLNTTLQQSIYNYSISTTLPTSLLRDVVLRLPTLLGYSFERRIRPRMDAIVQAGLHPSSITIGIPMKQDDFDVWLQRRVMKNERNVIAATSSLPLQHDSSASSRDISSTRQLLLLRSAVENSSGKITTSNPDASVTNGRIVHWVRQRQPLNARQSS